MRDSLIKILVVEPMKKPYVQEISGSLTSMQAVVGGRIQAVYSFTDAVALICHDEGKILNLPPNRFLRDEAGQPYDVVCGTFFLTGLRGEGFCSLTEQQIQKYKTMYSREMLFPVKKTKDAKEKHTHER